VLLAKRIEDGPARTIEARRVANRMRPPPAKKPRGTMPETASAWGAPEVRVVDFAPPDGREAHAPRLALFADPWPGAMAVYSGAEGGGIRLAARVTRPAVMGRLLAPLAPGPVGVFDRARSIEVKLFGGTLAGLPDIDVLGGGNGAAIRTADGGWEILQFAEAELIAARTYRLRKLLRGQCSSEEAMFSGAPAGADFVLLDGAVAPLPVKPDSLGRPLRYRFGPVRDDHAGPSFDERTITAEGVGLRPFAPVHLRTRREPGSGDLLLSWTRRTRFGSDAWDAADVPLNEEREAYRLEVLNGSQVLRSVELAAPAYRYTAAAQAADFGAAAAVFGVRVAQMSAVKGPGFALQEVVHV
jgi:hypothetical protein